MKRRFFNKKTRIRFKNNYKVNVNKIKSIRKAKEHRQNRNLYYYRKKLIFNYFKMPQLNKYNKNNKFGKKNIYNKSNNYNKKNKFTKNIKENYKKYPFKQYNKNKTNKSVFVPKFKDKSQFTKPNTPAPVVRRDLWYPDTAAILKRMKEKEDARKAVSNTEHARLFPKGNQQKKELKFFRGKNIEKTLNVIKKL